MSTDNILARVLEVLKIPSPTYKEKKLAEHIKAKYFSHTRKVTPAQYQERKSAISPISHISPKSNEPPKTSSRLKSRYELLSVGDSFIAHEVVTKENYLKPHIALVGHLDVVPPFRPPALIGTKYSAVKISGAGASDMKASLGVFLHLLKDCPEVLKESPYRLSFIFYAKEEETPLEENGLYELINAYPAWFKTLNLAIVGEPTNNTIQIGCVGSIHAQVEITGKACHSARPWQGANALYKALPFIKNLSALKPTPHTIGGVTFYDVVQITELNTDPGTTTIPGWIKANVNFRFAPRFEKAAAINYFKGILKKAGLKPSEYQITSFSPMGKVVLSPLYHTVTDMLKSYKSYKSPGKSKSNGIKVEAKQAWTDVAQFGALNIPAFNFGPGLTAQCHAADEYALQGLIVTYTDLLKKILNPNFNSRVLKPEVKTKTQTITKSKTKVTVKE